MTSRAGRGRGRSPSPPRPVSRPTARVRCGRDLSLTDAPRRSWCASGLRAAIVLLGAAAVSRGAADPVVAAVPGGVRVGFGGTYRTGAWTPLRVEFADAGSAPAVVRVWTEDPDGQFVRSEAAAVAADAAGGASARLAVRFGRPEGRVLVECGAGEPAAASAGPASPAGLPAFQLPAPLASGETVLLVLGDLPAAERAARLLAREDGTRPRVVAIDPVGSPSAAGGLIGTTARDYDGADAIIVCGRAAAALDGPLLAGIDAWVRQGGRLVFLAGRSAAELGRAGSPAAGWLPGPVEKVVPLRRGAAVETYARSNRPLDRGALAGVEVPVLANARDLTGSVEAFEGRGPADLPLVVRRAHGFGSIAWLGLDADLPPFRTWSGADSLLVELLGGRAFTLVREGGREAETRRGALDLAGQLRRAVDRFTGVSPIPFEVIAGLGLAYVACLYPLDWWITGGGRRGWLAWLSLPAIVALAAGLTGAVAGGWHGAEWRTNAAEMVDVDLESRLVRVSAFAGVWSPENARLAVSVGPADGGRELLVQPAVGVRGEVTWFAAAGRAIGATDAVAAHPSLASGNYASVAVAGSGGAGLTGLVGVPVAASSSRLFETVVTGSLAGEPLRSTLRRQGQGTLRGAVESRLPFALEQCGLLHGGWYYDIGRLAPGAIFDTGLGRGPRSLSGALTRRTANKDREIAIRWNPAEEDALRILEIAGFHVAAGGAGYTSLEPGRLALLDLSPLLPLDRGVIVGRGPALVDWRCSATPVSAGAAATPVVSGTAALWRFVVPLGAAPRAAMLDDGGGSGEDAASPRSAPVP